LTEEKLRLQTQVIELERDVDELSRSRDEFRQAAVQEGSQYVEIVKKASRLEEMAAEERKSWNTLKEGMERRIEALSSGKSGKGNIIGTTSASTFNPSRRVVDDIDTDTPASSIDFSADFKIEPMNEALPDAPTSHPVTEPQESAEDLKEEIRQLRQRCTEVEDTLRTIRDDSRSIEGLVKALQERADSTLKD
jgi:predicted RNase H-like nuclease (RuvC/YqgF family)